MQASAAIVLSDRHERPRTSRPSPAAVGRRRRPDGGRAGAAALAKGRSTPTRCSPTTWPTPPPRSRPARSMLDYGAKGEVEAAITCAFVADAVADLAGQSLRPRGRVGRRAGALDEHPRLLSPPTATLRSSPDWQRTEGPRHLDADFELVQDTFRRFADEKLKPIAEHIHRHNADIPEDVITGLAEMGAFGLSIPEEYGGYGQGGESEYMGMVVATEELSAGLARRRRLADHPTRDPRPRPRQGRHRGAEAAVASPAGGRGGHERGRRHRARLRVRRRRHQGHRHADRRRLAHQRRQDMVHLRAPAPTSSCCWPAPIPTAVAGHRGLSLFIVEKRAGRRRGLRARRQDGRRSHGGSADRHDRLPGHALLRAGLRELVRPGREPRSAATAESARASTCRWPASRTAGCRPPPEPSA